MLGNIHCLQQRNTLPLPLPPLSFPLSSLLFPPLSPLFPPTFPTPLASCPRVSSLFPCVLPLIPLSLPLSSKFPLYPLPCLLLPTSSFLLPPVVSPLLLPPLSSMHSAVCMKEIAEERKQRGAPETGSC